MAFTPVEFQIVCFRLVFNTVEDQVDFPCSCPKDERVIRVDELMEVHRVYE